MYKDNIGEVEERFKNNLPSTILLSSIKEEQEVPPTQEEDLIKKLSDQFTNIMKDTLEQDSKRQKKIAYLRKLQKENPDIPLAQPLNKNGKSNRDYILDESEIQECIRIGALQAI